MEMPTAPTGGQSQPVVTQTPVNPAQTADKDTINKTAVIIAVIFGTVLLGTIFAGVYMVRSSQSRKIPTTSRANQTPITVPTSGTAQIPTANRPPAPAPSPALLNIIYPKPGATVNGIVIVYPKATDTQGLIRADLLVDGVAVATISAQPYYFSWDTTKFNNGIRVLVVNAYSQTGLVAIGRSYVTVNNTAATGTQTTTTTTATAGTRTRDTTPPGVVITSPVQGATLAKGSTVTVQAIASDNIAVAKVTFFIGSTTICTSNTAPYSCSIAIPGNATGSVSLSAKAADTSGNVSTNTITVTIN